MSRINPKNWIRLQEISTRAGISLGALHNRVTRNNFKKITYLGYTCIRTHDALLLLQRISPTKYPKVDQAIDYVFNYLGV